MNDTRELRADERAIINGLRDTVIFESSATERQRELLGPLAACGLVGLKSSLWYLRFEGVLDAVRVPANKASEKGD